MASPRLHAVRVGAVAIGAAVGLAVAVSVDAGRSSGKPADQRAQAWPPSPFEGSPMPADVPVPDVTLRDERGRGVRLSEVGGPAVVTFGSAVCEETCPLQAQIVRGALDALDEDVPAFIVSVDRAEDTPERARHFLAEQRLTRRARFLLGSDQAMAAAWRGFAVAPQTRRSHHQARIVLIDGRGRQRVGTFADQATPATVAHDLRLLVSERGRERERPVTGRAVMPTHGVAAGGGG